MLQACFSHYEYNEYSVFVVEESSPSVPDSQKRVFLYRLREKFYVDFYSPHRLLLATIMQAFLVTIEMSASSYCNLIYTLASMSQTLVDLPASVDDIIPPAAWTFVYHFVWNIWLFNYLFNVCY